VVADDLLAIDQKAGRNFLAYLRHFQAPTRLALSGRLAFYASGRSARRITAHVAQSVEHLHGKQKVSGSIPLVGSINCAASGALR
jgi:hypothetical protein